jgi:hypothetical protein
MGQILINDTHRISFLEEHSKFQVLWDPNRLLICIHAGSR